MEISCQLKFNPSLPLNPLCFRQEFRRSSSLSFNPVQSVDSLSLCADRGLNVRCSPFKHFNGKSSKRYDLPAIHLQSRSKHVSTSASSSWCVFNPNAGSNQLCHDYKWHKQIKLLRYVVARYDIAGTGCSDAAHQLSEIGLGSKVRGVCFYVITASLSIFLFMLMMVAHPFVLLFDRHRRKVHHFVAKLWALFTVSPFLKVEVVGLDNLPAQDTPAVYVSNHQSFLDTYVLLTLGRSFKFISKTSIFLYPIIGWAMFLMGAIPLKRMDSRSQLQTLKRCMDLLKNGGSVFFFPEGTRSKDGNLGVFKKGAFSVAAKCRVPVVPITLIGTGKIMPSGMEGILNPGSVKVFIHKAIDGNNADILCNEVRNIIADTLIRQGYAKIAEKNVL